MESTFKSIVCGYMDPWISKRFPSQCRHAPPARALTLAIHPPGPVHGRCTSIQGCRRFYKKGTWPRLADVGSVRSLEGALGYGPVEKKNHTWISVGPNPWIMAALSGVQHPWIIVVSQGVSDPWISEIAIRSPKSIGPPEVVLPSPRRIDFATAPSTSASVGHMSLNARVPISVISK
jgi:hypothetical protein